MSKNSFDLIVIGTGTAASSVTFRCRDAGWSVAAVEDRPPGGTCSQRGCDPKKILMAGAEAVDWARRMNGKGVAGSAAIRWPDLIAFKKNYTDPIPKSTEEKYGEAGVPLIRGRARFADPETIEANGRRLKGRRIVLATGMLPRPLGFPGADLAVTSDAFMELESLPRRVVFIGGGYVSFEFAHLARRAGSEVTVLQKGERPLRLFDPDLVDRLIAFSRDLGIDVRLGCRVTGIERGESGLLVRTDNRQTPLFEADLVVHGAGRVPNLHDMDLDKGDVEATENGVRVNAYLQSVSNGRVYAAGDCAETKGFALTPTAGLDGVTVAHNLLKGNTRKPDYSGLPSVVFSIPQLARAGMTETECRAAGLEFDVFQGDTSGWYSNRRMNAECGGFKTLVDKHTDHVLGAHLLGWEAAETINLFALAIRLGLTAAQLRHGLYAYPTQGSDLPYMLK